MDPDSAKMGEPPNTEQDILIVKGLFHTMGVFKDLDPSKGFFFIPPKPPGYVSESKADVVLGVVAMAIVLQIAATSGRLALRLFLQRAKWGWDDWTIIPGLVCQRSLIALASSTDD